MSNDGRQLHGADAGLRNGSGGDAAAQLSALERERPELAPWLRPLGVALAAIAAEPWCSLAPLPAGGRAPDAPLLHGATVPLDLEAAHALVAAVLEEALGEQGREAAAQLDACALLAATVPHDLVTLDAMADATGVDSARFTVAAHLASLPLLQTARAALEQHVPASWDHGYCPICGALPALVEVLGLDRRRALRCGRCGAAWGTQVLLCAFCGERDHERLGSLVPEGRDGQLRWIETCAGCHGYLKAFTALRGAAPHSIPLQDAASLELDMAALDRGFARPRRPGYPARPHLVAPAPAAAPTPGAAPQ